MVIFVDLFIRLLVFLMKFQCKFSEVMSVSEPIRLAVFNMTARISRMQQDAIEHVEQFEA